MKTKASYILQHLYDQGMLSSSLNLMMDFIISSTVGHNIFFFIHFKVLKLGSIFLKFYLLDLMVTFIQSFKFIPNFFSYGARHNLGISGS